MRPLFNLCCFDMALKATIFKADLQIADMDRGYYQDHSLTLARHPSETDARMMVRLLAFALNADERLQFTKGLSTDDEPDVWQKSLSDEIECWIDVGLPSDTRVRKACNRSQSVAIYAYGDRSARVWKEQNLGKLERFKNLKIYFLKDESVDNLAELAKKNMSLQCTVQDGQVWLGDTDTTVEVEPELWFGSE